MKFLITICFLLAFSSQALAQKKLEALVLCRNGNNVRSIYIEKRDGAFVCIYSKRGNDQQVGQGQNIESVKGIMDNIKGNLEAARWQCREATQASLLESES